MKMERWEVVATKNINMIKCQHASTFTEIILRISDRKLYMIHTSVIALVPCQQLPADRWSRFNDAEVRTDYAANDSSSRRRSARTHPSQRWAFGRETSEDPRVVATKPPEQRQRRRNCAQFHVRKVPDYLLTVGSAVRLQCFTSCNCT